MTPAGKRKTGLTGERAFIEALRRRSKPQTSSVRLGMGDDCAILRPRQGEEIVITTDFSLENVHFRRDWHSAEAVGHRCLARGLSDLAAMGARPLAAFLSLAVPAELTISRTGGSWADRFVSGLLALAALHKVPLAGGDTAQSPSSSESGLVAADIVLVGGVARGRALLRCGARAGDMIYVTGALGGAAAELLALSRTPAKFRKRVSAAAGHPHLFPEPRLVIGRRLVTKRLATAAIDLSDGLSIDLRHICEESGLAAELEAAAIPVHRLAIAAEAHRWIASAMKLALDGGEDYELLFTANSRVKVPSKIAGVAIHPIGRMKPRRAGQPLVRMVLPDGKYAAVEAGGWEHFRE